MKTFLIILGGAAALSVAAPSLRAQAVREPTRFGVQVSYGNDSKFGIGARVRHSLRGLFPATPLSGFKFARDARSELGF